MSPELLFTGVALCSGILGASWAGAFRNRGVKIGLLIAAIGGLVWLFIESEKLC
jgi:hypothetical protein